MRNFLTLLLAACVLCVGCHSRPAQAQQPPNIILVFCDDLGYGDVGVFWQNERAQAGQPAHATPHIDRMAQQGVRMTHTYCPAPVCAPSRASLMLGVTQGHANVRNNQFDKALEDNHTLASVLGEAGYATAAFGKWGLQGQAEPGVPHLFPAHPMNRGFDYFLGYIRHRDGHMHYPLEDGKELYDGSTNIAEQLALCYTTDLFTARTKKWIVDHVTDSPDQPFFVYLAYDTPHAKLQNPPCAYPEGGGLDGGVQWRGEPGAMLNTATGVYDGWVHPDYADQDWPEQYRRYANSVRRIDDSVGDLLSLLEDLDIDDNTVVIFTTDNGPSRESYLDGMPYSPEFFHSYGPFDGIKRDLWEGGIRTGAIVRWPGMIPAGTLSDTPLTFADYLATFADIAGIDVPARSDGVSVLPAMTGHGEQAEANIYIEYEVNGRTPGYPDFERTHAGRRRGQMQAIRLGDYIAVRYNIQSHDDAFEFYNIVEDPKQTANLADQPGLQTLLREARAEVLRRRRPNPSAPRPYDNTPIPAVESDATQAGLNLAVYARATRYVPRLDDAQPIHTEQVNGPALLDTDQPTTQVLSGYFLAHEAGEYTFRLTSPNRFVLRLHRATLIDADHRFAANQPYTATVHLEAGLHPILLHVNTEANETTGDFELTWSGPSRADDAIESNPWMR
ncbi:MAG: sulfatase-like hydrolase/transferase [Phycisphaerales bacterium JB063]